MHFRIGVVLSPAGGALSKMLLPFQLGLGGRVGNGRQGMSWISIDDLVRAMYFCFCNAEVQGPVNLVAPQAVDNAQFTKTLARTLCRPSIFPLPGFVAKTLFGEMAEELLLNGAFVSPKKLQDAGFRFLHQDLESALRHVLGK